MIDGRNKRITWGIILLVGALGCASLRNNPALGISPLAIGIIEGLIFVCIMAAVRIAGWKLAAVIALATPIYLWAQRFLDGFMVPVDIAVNLTMIGCMKLAMKGKNYWLNAILLTLPAFAVMLLAGTLIIWIVKDENLIRSAIITWNTDVYSGLSIIGAALLCAPHKKAGSPLKGQYS